MSSIFSANGINAYNTSIGTKRNNARKYVTRNLIFRDTEKIVNVTNIVTTAVTSSVTKKIQAIQLLYDNLYKDVGETIKNLFKAFMTGSNELKELINYDNYTNLADKLYDHFNDSNENFENFRKLLSDAIEGVKHCDNRMMEQMHAYETLLKAYNEVIGPKQSAEIISLEAEVKSVATIRPEIIEYIRRGNNIVDSAGNLIPIDMDILAQIREELNLA